MPGAPTGIRSATARWSVVLAAAVTVTGCGRAAGGHAVTTADSAGVTMVTSRVPAWSADSGWRVDMTPDLTIGDSVLGGVTGVRQLGDGTIAVTLNDEKMIRWFDLAGRQVRQFGRNGEGPGEFRNISLSGVAGDSLVLWDVLLRRVTLLAPDGGMRSFIGVSFDTLSASGLALSHVFADGRLLLTGRRVVTSGMSSGLRRDSVARITAARDGTIERLVTWTPYEQVAITGPIVTAMPRPFSAQTAVAVADNTMLVSLGDRDEVVRHAADGGVIAIYRLDRPRRAITAAELATQRRRFAEQMAEFPEELGALVTAAFADVSPPSNYATHDRILVDNTGAIWLREDIGPYRDGIEDRRWTVLDRDGRWLGAVTTPARFDVHQVTRDRAIGIWRDEDGVEHLRVHRLVR